jgi:glycosyltransferase involved in cell wall biosynthesis
MLYFLYPLWLILIAHGKDNSGLERGEINRVSLILLTYNGKEYLDQKIADLNRQLNQFKEYEMIILDDASEDGSQEILCGYVDQENTRLIIQEKHMGIPYAMNLGVREAKYDHIIFCDQRQNLTPNILNRLLAPLSNEQIGAVSGCISHMDKKDCYSMIRRYENFIKTKESSMGNLIGVYGPLYAVKKECYVPIPQHIILDDLYLSLQIIKTKQVRILGDCKIIDENICDLYDFSRAKRYLTGFWQIARDKTIWNRLNIHQLIMLLWHKYLRLTIPVLLFISYLGTGVAALTDQYYLVAFILMSIGISISLIPKVSHLFKPSNFIRLNALYFIALMVVIGENLIFYKSIARN